MEPASHGNSDSFPRRPGANPEPPKRSRGNGAGKPVKSLLGELAEETKKAGLPMFKRDEG